MAKTIPKKYQRYCFRRRGGATTISVPYAIAEQLGIKDGEKVEDWKAIRCQSEEKTLKIRIIRGESIYVE